MTRQVILYSTTLHEWEVWSQGRPLGHGSLEACKQTFPKAEGPSQHQIELEQEDSNARL